jgi:hypothetical protein
MAQLDANGVPVLSLGTDASREVAEAQDAFLTAAQDGKNISAHLLVGTVVVLHNGRPAGVPGGAEGASTTVVVGGETLDEALKSIVGAFDTEHSGRRGVPDDYVAPDWVASTHEPLARLLAEHYTDGDHTCAVLPLDEVAI